jgi:hypothetical protein
VSVLLLAAPTSYAAARRFAWIGMHPRAGHASSATLNRLVPKLNRRILNALRPAGFHHRIDRRRGIHAARAHAAIVGGSEISVEHAPWQVAVFQAIPVEEGFAITLCGGVILGETSIVTAGHCATNPVTETKASPEHMLVVAGLSNLENEEASEQVAEVQAVRVHPYFDYAAGPGTADDVAVLTLAKPLSLGGSAAQAIGMVPAGGEPPEGTPVELTGFGEENPATEELTGQLHSLGMTVLYSRECGGEADALFACASAPAGSACSGDSGSGLTARNPTPSVLGITDTVEVRSGQRCVNGAVSGFANLAAPEIRDFVEGSEAPPQAPRGGKALIRGVPSVGHALICEPGSWSNGPTFTYTFIDSAGSQILQQGTSSTYSLSAADVGRQILCQVQAANAGGTGIGRTPPLEAIQAATSGQTPPPPVLQPPPPVVLPQVGPPPFGSQPQPVAGGGEAPEPGSVGLRGSTLAVNDGSAVVDLACVGSEACSGKLTLTVQETRRDRDGHRHKRTLTIGVENFSISADGTVTVKIALDASGRALLSRDRGSLAAHLTILQLDPAPTQSQADGVRLQEATSRRGSKRHRH